jgi:NAD(P)-dependent dehydrogenase (short-subunit alcohol dehydrogenase family)
VAELGSTAVAVQVDIASSEAPLRIIAAALEAFQATGLDILINNAGLGGNTALETVTVQEYELLMSVNVRAVLFMTQAFVQHVSPGGRIVNLSSISARGGFATQTVYAASKSAVEGMTRVWATELGHKYQITVNAINPGPVDTDMYRAAGDVHLARMAKENEKTPAAPRAGMAEDVADIVCFLCEERSRWITGDVICANGGMIFS